jgi:hypothetical protein
MSVLKKTLFAENLENYSVLIQDTDPTSKYFKVTELPVAFTGGKNAFLIQGSEFLVADTLIKIEIKDAKGNVIYHEPGEGIPEYYEGTSKVIAVYIYPDTAFGPCTITILGEVKEYEDSNGLRQPVPLQYKDTYNVRWQGSVNVNPLLANTTKIRFYRRPKIEITEQVLPVYNRIVGTQTVSGTISGVPISPISGSDYKTYKGILQYQLQMDGNENFSQSMEGTTMSIDIDGKYYTPTISDVISDKKAFVNVPYYITSSLSPTYQSVTGFKNKSFSITYENSEILSNSNVSSSFAVIKITDLESFSGDPARIKVYASSKHDLGDYQLLEDIQLESSEILLEREFNNQLNVRTGIFTQNIVDTFWTTSSIETNANISIDNSLLLKSVKLEPQSDFSSSVGLFSFEYATPFEFNKNTEYQLDFTPLLSSSVSNYGGLEIYLSGSAFANMHNSFGKEIYNEETKTSFRRYEKKQINFKPDMDGTGTLKFVVNGGTWQLANISLRAAHESAFAPNETTLIADVPTKINNETFDFLFEIYDINNNYVPVTIQQTHTFTGGNDIRIKRDLEVNVAANQFNFSTSSAFPSSILIDYIKTGLTGSVTFTSQAVDTTGLGITTGDLTMGSNYPGLLNIVDVDTVELPIEAFTASLSGGKNVGAITYTASCENIKRYFTIYRVEQGAPSYLFYATADKNNFTFDPDDNYKSVIPNDYIDIRLVQQNLPSISGLGLEIESGSESGTPAPLYYTGSVGNASIYRLFVSTSADVTPNNKSGYTYQIGQSHYDFRLITVDGIFTSSVIIDAIQKGDKGKGLIATSDRNQFFYKMTDLSATPSSQTAAILVKRQNLGSLTTPITYTKTGSGPDLTLVSQNIGNGVAQYSVSTSAYTYSMGETKYTFQASDLNGIIYYDEITLAALIAESQISVNLTNENATLPALSTGFVASGSFVLTSGSVSVKVGGEDINRSENLAVTNSWDIISATGTGCTPNDTTPDDATYGITSLTSDSGSLSLLVRYKDGRGSTTDITKVVTYTKSKKAAPVLEIIASPKDQSVTAKSTGEQIDSFSNTTITVRETYDGSTTNKTISNLTATSSDISLISTNAGTGLITLSGKTLGNSVNSTTVAISASVTDSEGSSRVVTNTLSLSKVKKAVPNVEMAVSPSAQSIQSNSRGSGSATPSTLTITALEGGDSRFVSIGTPTYTNGLNGTVSSNTIIFTSNASSMSADTGTITIPVNYTDSEGNSGAKNVVATVSKAKAARPNVVISATPQSQTVTAGSNGTQTGTLSNVTITALEGTTSRFTSMTVSAVDGINVNIGGTDVSSNTLVLSGKTLSSPEASITLTVTHTDSESSSGQTQTIVVRISKINQGQDGAPGVSVNISPASQLVTRTNTGTYSNPVDITTTITEGSTTYTYDNSSPYANSTFRITNVVNGTNNNNGTITPSTPSTTAGHTTTFDVVYVNSVGTSVTVAQAHRVSVALDGQTGPGVVFTGVWEASRAYQFSTGAGTGRRDVVLWSTNGSAPYEVYYAAIRQHTSAAGNVADGAPNQPAQTGWESLGTQDFFVAAKIGLFEESYVQNTLNVGTNSNGGVSSANITLAGGSANPYMSIGQSSTIGSQGYGLNGIFLGLDSSTAKFSLVNGTTSFLKWTGTGLEIKGSITVTGGDAATQTYANNVGTNAVASGSASAASAQAAAQLFATGVGNNAVLSGSAAASTAQSNATNSALSFASGAVNLLANGNWIGGSGTFITATSISSPIIAGNAGYISSIFKVGPNGITLDGTNKKMYIGTGNYNNTDTSFYADNDGKFSLKDKLTWDGTSLSVNGSINVTGGNAATQTYANTVGSNAVLSGSAAASTAQANATAAGQTAANNAAASASAAQLFAQTAAANAVTSGSNAASTAQTNATANALAFASGAVNLLANGSWVGGNGTFITSTSISSPIIAGNAGYISSIFKVGNGGITLDGTNKKMYIGTGNYNNTDTAFYVDNDGKMSLKNKLVWDGSVLTVAGTINANAGTFSGNITSTATISGGTISGGVITGGSINIGNGTFVVDGGGVLTATGANINGTITSNQGTIGGWNINEDGLSFSANNNARGVRLNSLRGALEITTSGSVTVDINSNEFLTNLSIATNVWTDSAMSITTLNIPGNGTYVYGAPSTVSFNLLAGQTYQFSFGSGFLPTVTGTSNVYNSVGYGVIISQNSTPTEANAEYFLSDGKYRSTAGEMQITPLSAVFTAASSGTYYIRPYVNGYSFNYIQLPGGEEDVQYIPLVLSSALYYYGNEIIRSTQKTEVVGGGIQVVKDTDTYFKVDRNASGGVLAPFVFATGASVAFVGASVGDANDFSVRDFESVSIGGTGGYISFAPNSATSFYDTNPAGNGGIRINSNNYIRLEPNGPGGYFAYVGYSNNANLQIKVANGTNPSDERVKTEIEILEDGSIEKINEIVLKTFKYKDCETGGPTGHKKIGVIAQDVQKTSLNGLVIDNSNGIQLEVDYDSLLGHALKAIQELSAKVEKLESIISGSI